MQILNNILSKIFIEDSSQHRILQEMVKGVFCVSSGGVTMKNISRWTEAGCSYRNIQRFMGSSVDWLSLNLTIVYLWMLSQKETLINSKRYILAVDEVVEPKSRTHTWGIGYFYSSILGQQTRSICCQVLSIVDTVKRKSFVLCQDQHYGSLKKKKKEEKKATEKKGKGRPPGSKSKKNVIEWFAIYLSLDKLLKYCLPALSAILGRVKYLVADGSYGNKNAILLVQSHGLELISKLQAKTAIYFPYEGESKRRKYGDRILEYTKEFLVSDTVNKKGVRTQIYYYPNMITRTIGPRINVVIILKTKPNGKQSKIVLFSTCEKLTAMEIIEFYRCRFQIEFNFRDAKQFFGLADFKNTKQQTVTNAIEFSFFMVNIANLCLEQTKEKWNQTHLSVLDLKTLVRAEKYIDMVLKYTEKNKKSILKQDQKMEIITKGAINLGFLNKKKAS